MSNQLPELGPYFTRVRIATTQQHPSDAAIIRLMSAPSAELSSIATALAELTERVGAMAERAASSKEDELSVELFAVERALTGAGRRLGRLIRVSGSGRAR